MDRNETHRLAIKQTFIGRGCAKRKSCLDWSKVIDVVVFASFRDICFVIPNESSRCTSINQTVEAHDSSVTCLKFLYRRSNCSEDVDYLLTGSARGNVRLWAVSLSEKSVVVALISDFVNIAVGPINCCTGVVLDFISNDVIIIGYALPNSLLNVERLTVRKHPMELVQKESYGSISVKPALIVSLAVYRASAENVLFIVGTTSNNIDLICASCTGALWLQKVSSVRGHSDWVCTISISEYENNILVATGGNESVIRIWRFDLYQNDTNEVKESNTAAVVVSFNLFDPISDASHYTLHISLLSILNAHHDWICSLDWHPYKMWLLSSSNDKTVIVWESAETDPNLWSDRARMGSIGGQAVGFFGACFSSAGSTILAYTYFGGFCSWQLEKNNSWKSVATFGGHSGQVKDIAWDPTGSYLLSCSCDQTTRCYAPSADDATDEKIFRVFTTPRSFIRTLRIVSKFDCNQLVLDELQLAQRNVSIPALGLSNMVLHSEDSENNEDFYNSSEYNSSIFEEGLQVEEKLMESTLWPEIQKLYGHGFEVFTVASNHSGTLVATSCKASTEENAFILIWDSDQWRHRCHIRCHKLTVVQLAFSNSESFLLSVSRDRTFAISARSSRNLYDWRVLLTSEQKYSKVHTRIIWCCSWSPDDRYFVTGSRDKKLCIWCFDGKDIQLLLQKKYAHAVTAVDFLPEQCNNHYILALGFENGNIKIERWSPAESDNNDSTSCLNHLSAHSETINTLRFRPIKGSWLNGASENNMWELASASDDSSVKVHQLILS
ncbi:unnamed protein product [Thelazia callipaeda]|uniref:Elongator complex protein 2 n=1 Tax=Thelazia callipaeda TaxID=103827 RepID=A0A158RAV4_THECL|nr:unnamed protein product [Thelazia callipaeda]